VAPRAAATEIGRSVFSPLRCAVVEVLSTDVAIWSEIFEILRELSLLFFIPYRYRSHRLNKRDSKRRTHLCCVMNIVCRFDEVRNYVFSNRGHAGYAKSSDIWSVMRKWWGR